MTASNKARTRRGQDTQNAVAAWFRSKYWPFAESTGSGRSGSDITGMPGLACEVKARRDFSPLAWIRQASTEDGLPFVVHRPDGIGTASICMWPVTLPLDVFTELLHAAGYGTSPPQLEAEETQ